jgi:hypothetical protein
LISLQNLYAFHDDASGDDCVGRGDGRDDIAGHGLDVEPTFLSNAENLSVKNV